MEGAKEIPDKLYFRIGDVAEIVGVKPYVLRYWESEFPVISPEKSATGQRVYRRSDVEMLVVIRHLLYKERYSIEGARRRIRELRKEGELKAFKEKTVQAPLESLQPKEETASPAVTGGISEETVKRLKSLSRELHDLAQRPIEELFHY